MKTIDQGCRLCQSGSPKGYWSQQLFAFCCRSRQNRKWLFRQDASPVGLSGLTWSQGRDGRCLKIISKQELTGNLSFCSVRGNAFDIDSVSRVRGNWHRMRTEKRLDTRDRVRLGRKGRLVYLLEIWQEVQERGWARVLWRRKRWQEIVLLIVIGLEIRERLRIALIVVKLLIARTSREVSLRVVGVQLRLLWKVWRQRSSIELRLWRSFELIEHPLGILLLRN